MLIKQWEDGGNEVRVSNSQAGAGISFHLPHVLHTIGFSNRTAVSELLGEAWEGTVGEDVCDSIFPFVYCNIKCSIINSTDLYMASSGFRDQMC